MKKIFILLGLPGSGKGTQGSIISDTMLIPHISTGDIFRKIISNQNSPDSEILKHYINEGKLVPSDVVNKIVRSYILSDECKQGCVLDGYPRNLGQAEYFIENIDADVKVLLFEAKDEIVKKRILGRIICSSCCKIYNRFFDPPKESNICDSCGGNHFVSRDDDTEDTVAKRLEEYKKETLPLVEYYRSKNKLHVIDGNKSMNEVTKELTGLIKKV